MNPPQLFVEFTQSALKAFHENSGVELPLERQPDGRLTGPCKEQVTAGLKNFLKTKSRQTRAQAFCAIGARGVSLRRLSLPAVAKEEFYRLLLLQIESEFPLSPDELAWGHRQLPNGAAGKQELLVAAVKREMVEDYSEILSACGMTPVFTLASLARNRLCPQSSESCAMLDVGGSQSELTCFERGVPTVSKIVFWGSETADLNLNGLSKIIKGSLTGTKLFISGNKLSEDFATQLARSVGNGLQCERLEVAGGEGRSAAIFGLKKFAEHNEGLPLVIQLKHTASATTLSTPDIKKWALRAAALVVALLLLPYAEAILFKAHLAKKVAAYKVEAVRLTVIDRELGFLQYLKQAQPPYLDALYLFSKSTPQGTRFDSLSMNGRGEVSLRVAFREGQQVTDFRAKLIESGFYTNVTVEEQSPTPDRQKVNVRISGQWKSLALLQSLSIGPTAEEIEKAKNAKISQPGARPGVTMPPRAMPPGMMMPGMENISPAQPVSLPTAPPAPRKEAK